MARAKKREVALRPSTKAWVLVQVEEATVGESGGDGLVALTLCGGGCDAAAMVEWLAKAIPFASAMAVDAARSAPPAADEVAGEARGA
jgi:hypothetical protein